MALKFNFTQKYTCLGCLCDLLEIYQECQCH